MWSNPGDIVLSPFMGIGSEGVMSVRAKRKFVGVELKEAYWKQACKHLADEERHAPSLFDALVA
jgi:DNA modification methylase